MTMKAAAAALLLTAGLAWGEDSRGPQMINLSCLEALVAVGQPNLAGVFSFISEKDGPAAFADLLVHDKKAMKKFLAKAEKDFKSADGISSWDHEAVMAAVSIYGSPLAETLEKPASGTMSRLVALSAAPSLKLEDLARRRK